MLCTVRVRWMHGSFCLYFDDLRHTEFDLWLL